MSELPYRGQLYLFVAMPSDYGSILFPVGSYQLAKEFIADTGGTLIAYYQSLN